MFNYENFEVEISTKLNTYLAAKTIVVDAVTKPLSDYIKAAPIPEKQSEFNRDADITWLYTEYGSSNFDTSKSIQPVIVQDESLLLVIRVLASNLRGDIGIYTTLDHIKMCLLGQRPSHCQLPLTLQKCEQLQNDQNMFEFAISFNTRTVAVQPTYEEPILGSPQRIPNYIVQPPNL